MGFAYLTFAKSVIGISDFKSLKFINFLSGISMIEAHILKSIAEIFTNLFYRLERESFPRESLERKRLEKDLFAVEQLLKDFIYLLSNNDYQVRRRNLLRLIEDSRFKSHFQADKIFTYSHAEERQLKQTRNDARELLEVIRFLSSDSRKRTYRDKQVLYNELLLNNNSDSFIIDFSYNRSPRAKPPKPRERQINIWLNEQTELPTKPLINGETYTINFNVDVPYVFSLTQSKEAEIADSDVPDDGLPTNWSLISDTLILSSENPNIQTSESAKPNRKTVYTADFDLLIPKQEASQTIQLQVKPTLNKKAKLEIRIYSEQQLYRKLIVTFIVKEKTASVELTRRNVVKIETDNPVVPAAHLNLRPQHEWATPDGYLTIDVVASVQKAVVNGKILKNSGGRAIVKEKVDWNVEPAKIDAAIENVIAAAETFRAKHQEYLDDIDETNFEERIQKLVSDPNYARPYNWNNLPFNADKEHQEKWEIVSKSNELQDLAVESHYLYQLIFPRGSQLRKYIESITPGHRINISWTDKMGNWIPHIPWGLLYVAEVPDTGNAVETSNFWGFRFRTEYYVYEAEAAPSDLGGLDQASQLYFLYWGTQTQDKTTAEAKWQKQNFESWQMPQQRFIPTSETANPKHELLKSLKSPNPPKTNILYFYCQCSVGDNNSPILRFGSTSNSTEIINRTELIRYVANPFVDRPLIFLNACSTSQPDAYRANLLEQSFFERECRAYIGTECKVPIKLASRFAAAFFNYLYRRVTPDPIAAGEAFTQARLFLLTQYLNIGGLFYTYVNLYDLYVANDDEVIKLRN